MDKYLIYLYVFFIASIFFSSTRLHRDFFYFLVVTPFLFTLNLRNLKTLIKSKLFILALTYCGYMLLTLVWSAGVGGGESFDVFRKALLVIVYLTITVCLFEMNSQYLDLLYKGICLSAGVSAVFYMALFYYYSGFSGRLGAFGVLSNPIPAASCFSAAVLVIFFFYLVQKEVSLSQKACYLLAMIASVLFVVLSQSRGPLLALASTLILCAALFRPKYVLWGLGGFVIPLVAVYASGLIDFLSFFSRADSYRLSIWRQSWDLFLRHPWLGYGIRGDRPEIIIAESIPAAHSHNLFLSTMLDGGVVALLLIVVLLSLAAHLAYKSYREKGDVTLIALIVFSVMANLTDGKTLIVSPNHQWFYFWLPIGLAAAYELASSRQKLPGTENVGQRSLA